MTLWCPDAAVPSHMASRQERLALMNIQLHREGCAYDITVCKLVRSAVTTDAVDLGPPNASDGPAAEGTNRTNPMSRDAEPDIEPLARGAPTTPQQVVGVAAGGGCARLGAG